VRLITCKVADTKETDNETGYYMQDGETSQYTSRPSLGSTSREHEVPTVVAMCFEEEYEKATDISVDKKSYFTIIHMLTCPGLHQCSLDVCNNVTMNIV